MTKVLIVGATGLVGRHVLDRALADNRVAHVVAPTRRPLSAHAKLHNPIVDFTQLPNDAEWWAVDGIVCALGTTRRAAGSAEAFRAVDFEYPLLIAGFARDRGATRLALTSSMGADPRSRFLYVRTKGELEAGVGRLGWDSLTIVRPGLLGGDRQVRRPAECIAAAVLRTFGPMLPPCLRISPASEVARVLLEGAIAGAFGTHIVDAGQLARADSQ
jgi:uncharacterized protein YbjT (DUF2867 family)